MISYVNTHESTLAPRYASTANTWPGSNPYCPHLVHIAKSSPYWTEQRISVSFPNHTHWLNNICCVTQNLNVNERSSILDTRISPIHLSSEDVGICRQMYTTPGILLLTTASPNGHMWERHSKEGTAVFRRTLWTFTDRLSDSDQQMSDRTCN